MTLLLIGIHLLATIGFGGGVLWGFIALLFSEFSDQLAEQTRIDRMFRIGSLALSCCLTALIFSGLALRFFSHPTPSPEPETIAHLIRLQLVWGPPPVNGVSPLWTTAQKLDLARTLLFGLQWIHWGWLEVVIQHPYRQALQLAQPFDFPNHAQNRQRVRRALGFQVLFTLAALVLTALSARSSVPPAIELGMLLTP